MPAQLLALPWKLGRQCGQPRSQGEGMFKRGVGVGWEGVLRTEIQNERGQTKQHGYRKKAEESNDGVAYNIKHSNADSERWTENAQCR